MYKILGNEYHFIETDELPFFRKQLGYKELNAPYVLKYNDKTKEVIDEMIMNADVVIYGESPISLIKKRYVSKKLTFRDDESRYKNPNRYLKWPIYTYQSHWLNKGYLLCASAYAPIDYYLSGMRPNNCFKWGYFTELKEYDYDSLFAKKRKGAAECVSILWAGRLIGLKHPESTIIVAEHLKKRGLSFTISIIGDGPMKDKLQRAVAKRGLGNEVRFLGAMSPEEVRDYMEQSDIFLFTSDRQEGWGAVLNESMNSGCAVVADGNIGSVPFLIEDGINGIVYKSKDWLDLSKKVESLVRNPQIIEEYGRHAYQTMTETWNGQVAAQNLISLCGQLLELASPHVNRGPCSPAPILMRTWRGRMKTL